MSSFTNEQHQAYDILYNTVYALNHNGQKLFFLTGKAGHGKTHVLDGLISYAQGQGDLPFIVAATALAASDYEL